MYQLGFRSNMYLFGCRYTLIENVRVFRNQVHNNMFKYKVIGLRIFSPSCKEINQPQFDQTQLAAFIISTV